MPTWKDAANILKVEQVRDVMDQLGIDSNLGHTMHHKISRMELRQIYEHGQELAAAGDPGGQWFMAAAGTLQGMENMEQNYSVGPRPEQRSDESKVEGDRDLNYDASGRLTPESFALKNMADSAWDTTQSEDGKSGDMLTAAHYLTQAQNMATRDASAEAQKALDTWEKNGRKYKKKHGPGRG